uniref:Uncharacterized protein n=1 Tax=Rhizophora mucronata TaxID=61149 RepID=A0A2P2J3I1_RHIMU
MRTKGHNSASKPITMTLISKKKSFQISQKLTRNIHYIINIDHPNTLSGW